MDLDYIPGWVRWLITSVVGVAGVRLFAVWLEAKRLEKRDLRETLSQRIRDLEARQEELHDEIAQLGAKVARQETENRHLTAHNQRLKEALSVHGQDGSSGEGA